jgi:RND family efflux transporter MFP subunit
MALIAIGTWLGFLWVLVKVGVLQGWTLWMKLSPIAIFLAIQIAVILPMSWSAPSGPATVLSNSIQITPSITGTVTEVVASSNVPLKKGDVLFQIDKDQYEALAEQVSAELELAEDQFQRATTLASKGAGRAIEVVKLKANVKVLKAKLKNARRQVSWATVKAPGAGFVPTMQLLAGTWIKAGQPVLAFIDTSEQIISVQIPQNYLRHVKEGQNAEIVFRLYPGKTFSAKVVNVVRATPEGQVAASGLVMAATSAASLPFLVELKLDDPIPELPPGATGDAAIYTGLFAASDAIRKITLRMTTWLNFF